MNMLLSPFIMMCYSTMIFSSLMALSSSNWIFFWLSMEINLISFIPIILMGSRNQESEGSIKYFLAQALGSSALLMFSISLWNLHSVYLGAHLQYLLLASILLKLGAAPCHFWYPSVMSSISWASCFILTTWQKFAPLCAASFFLGLKHNTSFLIAVGGLNAIVGGLFGLNQSKLRAVMAYSSVGHIGWMLSLSSIKMPVASMVYFVVYIVIVFPMFMFFGALNVLSSKSMSKVLSGSMFLVFFTSLMFLSLGGLPPLTGFLPKMMTIFLMMNKSYIVIFVLILGSVMNLTFYLNIILNFMMTSTNFLVGGLNLKFISSVIFFVTFAAISLGFCTILL